MNVAMRSGGPERPAPNRSAGSEFVWGMRLLGRGFAMYARYPGLFILGLVPAVISFVVVVAALVLLIVFINDIGSWVTWFADGWSADARKALRLLVDIAIVVGAFWLALVTYTALTLVIGDPFYEKISEKVDQRLGGTTGALDLPWYRTLPRNAVDSIRVVVTEAVLAVPTFLIGLIPVAGQIAAPILGAGIGGWLLSVDLTGIPFNRRGIFLSERRRILRANRALAMGFGVPVALLLLIPFVGILVIPPAIAGGTLLTRRVLGQPIE